MGGLHLNLDDAWPAMDGLPALALRDWGPRLRYLGRRADVEAFYAHVAPRLTPFILYGSGDFHYLAGLLLRRISTPVVLVSFDNHPDWDVRPPHWACGGWINRALELPMVQAAAIWGCGNFELAWPSRLFANHRALRSGRLAVHAWAERQSPGICRRFDCMSRDNWRDRFDHFVNRIRGSATYVTIDLDCLRADAAQTNWEQGLFTADDLAWALQRLRAGASVVGGDVCGAYSQPQYARTFQRLAARWDHPRLSPVDPAQAQHINLSSLRPIWAALTGMQWVAN